MLGISPPREGLPRGYGARPAASTSAHRDPAHAPRPPAYGPGHQPVRVERFLDVLTAAALVAGIVAYTSVVLGDEDRAARRALARRRSPREIVGGGGMLVLGIALAIDVDAYQSWDGWILAAIALSCIASANRGPLSRQVRDVDAPLDPSRRGCCWP